MFKLKTDSLQVLIDLGFLIPVSNLTLYHGRARELGETDNWKVNPQFNNAGNATGNQNIFAVSALSTASRAVAEEFAKARATELGGVPEVHQIFAKNGTELIVNYNFDVSQLSAFDRTRYQKALLELTKQSTSAMAPTTLKHREVYIPVYKALVKKREEGKSIYISEQMIEDVVASLNVQGINATTQLVSEVAGALNARHLLINNPIKAMHKFTSKADDFDRNNLTFTLSGKKFVGPFNLQYVMSYLSAYNIIGYYTLVRSATLNSKEIDAYIIFNTNQINTKQAIKQKEESVNKKFGGLTKKFEGCISNTEIFNFLLTSTPRQTVEYFKANYPMVKEVLNLKDHNRENFYISEHTETVLRVFQDSFASEIPKSLVPIVKIAIMSHDMGKGVARQNGKRTQDAENKLYSQKFFTELGIGEKYKKLLGFIVGESQSYTTMFYVRGQMQAGVSLIDECKKLLTECFGTEPTKDEVYALAKLCSLMQTCDTASYTKYAITRDQETGVHYYNDNAMFALSLKQPTGFLGRTVRMKSPKGME